MKKVGVSLVLFLLLANLVFVSSADSSIENIGDQLENANAKIDEGVNLVENPDQLQQKITDEYLKQEWKKIILDKPIIGPVYSWVMEHSLVFRILFGETFSFSIVFFGVVLLWFWLGFAFAGYSNLLVKLNGGFSLIIGFLISIILAQVKLLNIIVTFFIDLALSPDRWWVRIILILVLCLVAGLVKKLNKFMMKSIEQRREIYKKKAGEFTQNKFRKYFEKRMKIAEEGEKI